MWLGRRRYGKHFTHYEILDLERAYRCRSKDFVHPPDFWKPNPSWWQNRKQLILSLVRWICKSCVLCKTSIRTGTYCKYSLYRCEYSGLRSTYVVIKFSARDLPRPMYSRRRPPFRGEDQQNLAIKSPFLTVECVVVQYSAVSIMSFGRFEAYKTRSSKSSCPRWDLYTKARQKRPLHFYHDQLYSVRKLFSPGLRVSLWMPQHSWVKEQN